MHTFKHRSLAIAAVATIAFAAPAIAGVASPSDAVSQFALPITAVPMASGASIGAGGNPEVSEYRSGTTLESLRYRPRRRQRERERERSEDRWRESMRSTGYAQFHGGVFDPEDAGSNGAVFGMRVGGSIEERAQVGVALDWDHRANRRAEIVQSEPLPGGGTVERRVDIASSSFDLVPVLAFLQISPAGTQAGPYFGVGGGYEALFVTAEDFATGNEYEATFDGWGWQAWGGMAFPLGRQSRFNAEVFGNGGDLDREVDDDVSGTTVREIVNVNGIGARFGFSWTF